MRSAVTWMGEDAASKAPEGCSFSSLYVLLTAPSASASPFMRLIRMRVAVVAMPPCWTRGLPLRASIWSEGV